jgi:hypothetical protein
MEPYVEKIVRNAIHGEFTTEMLNSASDTTKDWTDISKALWKGEVRRRLSRAGLFDEETVIALSHLASRWLSLKKKPLVRVAGVSLRVPAPSMSSAWSQVMEWERGGISGKVLRYLTGYRGEIPCFPCATDLDLCQKSQIPIPMIDPSLASDYRRSMMAQVGSYATCRPVGSFRVALPEYTPLSVWDVNVFRVWVDPPDAMWIALECGDRIGPSFRWRVGCSKISQWVLPAGGAPILHLIVVALWRDLSVAGEALIGLPSRMGNSHDSSKRRLPVVRFGGLIDWGAGIKSLESSKPKSMVTAHLRKLPRGKRPSRQAFIRARRYGINHLPNGTTFVRPHKRKIQEVSVVRNHPPHLQGLASVMRIYGAHTVRDGIYDLSSAPGEYYVGV